MIAVIAALLLPSIFDADGEKKLINDHIVLTKIEKGSGGGGEFRKDVVWRKRWFVLFSVNERMFRTREV